MTTLYSQLCDELGIDASVATQMPLEVTKQAFFDRLAQHGIQPRTEEEAMAMLDASDRLEAKTAAIEAEHDPVAKALGILSYKTAAAPAASNDSQRMRAAQEYTAALMQNPEAYAGLLVNSVNG